MMCEKHNCASFGRDGRRGDLCPVCELEIKLQVFQSNYDLLMAENQELKNVIADLRADLEKSQSRIRLACEL